VTGALLTDLYELNMAASYLRRGMVGPATFSLFVRRLPPNRGFLVNAGLEDCLDFLERFRFDEDELAYLGDTLGFDRTALQAFRGLRFTGEVWAVPEGRIVFAGEPILEVTAPIAEGQLVETALLNVITFQTTVASKAARCVIAAAGRDVVDFAMRRTHGVDAARGVARCSAIAGFAATSNVEAARRYGLAAAGTMAHSFVEAYESEEEAFRAFAQDFPGRTTFLVDTYDTMNGVRAAIRVIRELGLSRGVGVRLDSGDLLDLSRGVRALLDAEGLGFVRIFASGGLDELGIDELVRAGAPIDAFGVGTRIGVSEDAPYVDSVYKLVQFGERPVLKLSPGKITAPGPKQVFRRDGMTRDLVALRSERCPPGCRPILERAMLGGRRVRARDTLPAARARFEEDLAELPAAAKALRSPTPPPVERSDRLRELIERVSAMHRAPA
jgi:nicotinate phosphoribosyltransferase